METKLAEKNPLVNAKLTQRREELLMLESELERLETEKEEVGEDLDEMYISIIKQKSRVRSMSTVTKELQDLSSMLQQAREGIQNITNKDLMEITTYNNPPVRVKMALEAIMFILKGKVLPWADIVKEIKTDFVGRVMNINWVEIPETTWKKMDKLYFSNPEWESDKMTKASSAIGPLSVWLMSQQKNHKTLKDEYAKQNELQELRNNRDLTYQKIKSLEDKYDVLENRITDIKDDISTVKKRIEELKLEGLKEIEEGDSDRRYQMPKDQRRRSRHVTLKRKYVPAPKKRYTSTRRVPDEKVDKAFQESLVELSSQGDNLSMVYSLVHVKDENDIIKKAKRSTSLKTLTKNNLQFMAGKINGFMGEGRQNVDVTRSVSITDSNPAVGDITQLRASLNFAKKQPVMDTVNESKPDLCEDEGSLFNSHFNDGENEGRSRVDNEKECIQTSRDGDLGYSSSQMNKENRGKKISNQTYEESSNYGGNQSEIRDLNETLSQHLNGKHEQDQIGEDNDKQNWKSINRNNSKSGNIRDARESLKAENEMSGSLEFSERTVKAHGGLSMVNKTGESVSIRDSKRRTSKEGNIELKDEEGVDIKKGLFGERNDNELDRNIGNGSLALGYGKETMIGKAGDRRENDSARNLDSSKCIDSTDKRSGVSKEDRMASSLLGSQFKKHDKPSKHRFSKNSSRDSLSFENEADPDSKSDDSNKHGDSRKNGRKKKSSRDSSSDDRADSKKNIQSPYRDLLNNKLSTTLDNQGKGKNFEVELSMSEDRSNRVSFTNQTDTRRGSSQIGLETKIYASQQVQTDSMRGVEGDGRVLVDTATKPRAKSKKIIDLPSYTLYSKSEITDKQTDLSREAKPSLTSQSRVTCEKNPGGGFDFRSNKNITSSRTLSKDSGQVFANTGAFKGSEYDTFANERPESTSDRKNYVTFEKPKYAPEEINNSYRELMHSKPSDLNEDFAGGFYEMHETTNPNISRDFHHKVKKALGYETYGIEESLREMDEVVGHTHNDSRFSKKGDQDTGFQIGDHQGNRSNRDHDLLDRFATFNNHDEVEVHEPMVSETVAPGDDTADIHYGYSDTVIKEKKSEYDISEMEATRKKSVYEIDSPKQLAKKSYSLMGNTEKLGIGDTMISNPEFVREDKEGVSMNFDNMRQISDISYKPSGLFETDRSLVMAIGMLREAEKPVPIVADFTKSFFDGYLADNIAKTNTDLLFNSGVMRLKRESEVINKTYKPLAMPANQLFPEEPQEPVYKMSVTAPQGFTLVESEKSIKLDDAKLRTSRAHTENNNYSFNVAVSESNDTNFIKSKKMEDCEAEEVNMSFDPDDPRAPNRFAKNTGGLIKVSSKPLPVQRGEKDLYTGRPKPLHRQLVEPLASEDNGIQIDIQTEAHISDDSKSSGIKLPHEPRKETLTEEARLEAKKYSSKMVQVSENELRGVGKQPSNVRSKLGDKDANTQTDLNITKFKGKRVSKPSKPHEQPVELDAFNKNIQVSTEYLAYASNQSRVTKSVISQGELTPMSVSRDPMISTPQSYNSLKSVVKVLYNGTPITQEEYRQLIEGKQIKVTADSMSIQKPIDEKPGMQFQQSKLATQSPAIKSYESYTDFKPLNMPPVRMVESRTEFSVGNLAPDRRVVTNSYASSNYDSSTSNLKSTSWVNTVFNPLGGQKQETRSDVYKVNATPQSAPREYVVQSKLPLANDREISPFRPDVQNGPGIGRNVQYTLNQDQRSRYGVPQQKSNQSPIYK